MQEMPLTRRETFDTLIHFNFFAGQVEIMPLMDGHHEE